MRHASGALTPRVSKSRGRWPKSGIVKTRTASEHRSITANACVIGFGCIKPQSFCMKSDRMRSDERLLPQHDRPFWPARRIFLDRTPPAHCQGKPSPPKTRSRGHPHPRGRPRLREASPPTSFAPETRRARRPCRFSAMYFAGSWLTHWTRIWHRQPIGATRREAVTN